jgi:hypothetical protein
MQLVLGPKHTKLTEKGCPLHILHECVLMFSSQQTRRPRTNRLLQRWDLKHSATRLHQVPGSSLKSHLLVENASWMVRAMQNTVLLVPCDSLLVLNHGLAMAPCFFHSWPTVDSSILNPCGVEFLRFAVFNGIHFRLHWIVTKRNARDVASAAWFALGFPQCLPDKMCL